MSETSGGAAADRKYRVIQWGAGYTGYYSIKYVLMNPKLELVAIKCHTEEKEGKTAGELSGGQPAGVRATRNARELLDVEADCIIYMPRDPFVDPSVPGNAAAVWFEEMLAILASGKNVVTSLTAGTHHRHLQNGQRFVDQLNAACAKGKSSVLFTGFDPGFSDVLAYTMSGAVGGVTQIRTWEIVDYGDYTVPETLHAMGYGKRPQELSADGVNVVRLTWGGVPYLLAEALGVVVEELKVETDFYLSPRTFTAPGGLVVKEGTIGALKFAVIGVVNGKPMLIVNHVTRIGPAMAPEWPTIGRDGGYRVEIDSFPPFRGDFPMGFPGGTGTTLADAMAMTAGRCVNAVEAVVNAKPGYRTFLDLPPLGGRYTLTPR